MDFKNTRGRVPQKMKLGKLTLKIILLSDKVKQVTCFIVRIFSGKLENESHILHGCPLSVLAATGNQ